MPESPLHDHPSAELLREFARGRASTAEVERIGKHLDACASCRDAIAQADQEDDGLAQWVRQAGHPGTLTQGDATVTPPRSEDAAAAPMPSRLLGRYEILGELGRGGMGVVYKARDLQLRRLVAIKMIRVGSFEDTDARSRFHAEGLAVARLRHPHIVQLLEVGEENGTPYQVLEFLEGGSLAAQDRHRPQEFAYAARLVQTLAEAVEHAHAQGIIHRDLKPANVLLTADGVAKLSDFGLVKFDRRQLDEPLSLRETSAGNILGTPLYMAPEQARGVPGTIGPSTDIYALGVILYELLTGRPPFADESSSLDVLQALQQREPVSPRARRPDLPRDLEVICLKCLRLEPQHRYATAGELAAELGRFLRGEPILARPLAAWEKARRWCRRNPLPAGLLGGLAAVILTSLGLLTYLYLDADSQRERAQQNERAAQDQTRIAEQQRTLAQRQKAEADKQREDALAFLDIARRAVETFHSRVMLDPKLKTHDFRDLRQALLASTVQFHQALIQRRSDDPTLQALQGRAHRQLGDVQAELGKNPEALEAYARAITLLQSLRARHPQANVVQSDLVAALHQRAKLLADLGRLSEAFADYRLLLPLQTALAADTPMHSRQRSNLIALRGNFAQVLYQSGERAEAESLWLENERQMAELVAANPQPQTRVALASLRNNLGTMAYQEGRFPEAVTYLQAAWLEHTAVAAAIDDPRYQLYALQTALNLGPALAKLGKTAEALAVDREALRRARDLVRRHPSVPAYRELLGGLACNIGVLLSHLQQPDEAVACFDEAVQVLEEVLKIAPRLVTARDYLGNAFVGRAGLHNQMLRHADALRDWDRALQLDPSTNGGWTAWRRARTLLLLKRRDEAVTAMEKAALPPTDPHLRLFAAGIWALAAEQAVEDSPEAARALQESLRLLRGLATEGFLQKPEAVETLRTHREYDILKNHPDFQRLLPATKPP